MVKATALVLSAIDLDTEPSNSQEVFRKSAEIVPLGANEDRLDHFVERDGLLYAGTHLIIDLWGASKLDQLEHVKETLIKCVRAAGATLLHIHLHHFTPNGGVSGVAVLAESHISIHTWPERDYAALDIFMCGNAKPHKAVAILREAFQPRNVQLGEQRRGLVDA